MTNPVQSVQTQVQDAIKALPFVDQLPQPGQIVDSAFSLAEKMLTDSREFVGKLLSATSTS